MPGGRWWSLPPMNRRSSVLPANSAGLVAKTFAVYAKDIRIEFRNRYATSVVLMFAVTTLAMISFSVGQASLDPQLLAALFWIALFFSAMAGLSAVFVREEESGTALTLRLKADPTAVFLGKLLFNFTLLALVTIVLTPLFFVMTDASTGQIWAFILVLLLGVIGLCSATTLIGAIIARAAFRGALFSVLSFPILIILLLMLVTATTRALAEQPIGEMLMELQGLVAYAVVMLTGSLLLFRFVWRE
ncbi:heme ABC transporter permease CcmB [candidate division GN15 bacterium]|nr:heme ABC transporter permease CcmB [candidate division GN15 bacterium]